MAMLLDVTVGERDGARGFLKRDGSWIAYDGSPHDLAGLADGQQVTVECRYVVGRGVRAVGLFRPAVPGEAPGAKIRALLDAGEAAAALAAMDGVDAKVRDVYVAQRAEALVALGHPGAVAAFEELLRRAVG